MLHEIRAGEENRFDEFLTWLRKRFDVVSYSEAIARLSKNELGNYVAVSFDDGLKNHLNAARILTQHGISACFFVCPGIVGEANQDKVKAFCRERMLFPHVSEFMDWNDIELICREGHEIGNHSQSHFYMNELSDDRFDEEVVSAREEIVSRIGEVKHFAWPYGRFFHFVENRIERVLQLGHESCASAERGAHLILEDGKKNSTSLPCIRRDTLDMAWPTRHCKYFVQRSRRTPLSPNNLWPKSS